MFIQERLSTMAATQQAKEKCKGKAIAEFKSCKAEQIWPLWADFCNVNKWFPNLASCSLVEGKIGNEVGSVRYCVGEAMDGREEVMWAKERLVEIEHEKRLLRYEVIESNFGLKGYVAEIRVYDKKEGGCTLEWRFEVDAMAEGFKEYVQSSLDFIAKKMEEAIRTGLP